MVMRGGGRNREIQRLQGAAAANGGEGTARQQARLDYLQRNPQAGRRPQGPQTGGPLMNAMGPGGQDAIRTQQPYRGGRMGIDGVTMEGGPMPMDGGQGAYGNYQEQLARQAPQLGMHQAPQSGVLKKQPGEVPQEMLNQMGPITQYPSWGNGAPPMQRPTPGQNDAGFALPNPMQRPGPQGPDYFRGQGMDNGRFAAPGSPRPYQAPVQGDQIRGGGVSPDRFSRPGYTARSSPVRGNQFAGGGTSPARFNSGVLAPPPKRMR
jgi:hypothetical protein